MEVPTKRAASTTWVAFWPFLVVCHIRSKAFERHAPLFCWDRGMRREDTGGAARSQFVPPVSSPIASPPGIGIPGRDSSVILPPELPHVDGAQPPGVDSAALENEHVRKHERSAKPGRLPPQLSARRAGGGGRRRLRRPPGKLG